MSDTAAPAVEKPLRIRQLEAAKSDHEKAAADLKAASTLDGVDRTQTIAEHLSNAAKCAAQLDSK